MKYAGQKLKSACVFVQSDLSLSWTLCGYTKIQVFLH